MTKQEQIETLKAFNEKAEKLLNSSIGNGVLSHDICCSVSWNVGNPITITSPDFDKERLDAFLLTFRMFIQNNDRISIGQIKKLYDEMPISDELKARFNEARDELNLFLDRPPIFSVAGEPKTNRDLKETVLFGDLSHLNEAKRTIFRKWMSDPLVAPHIWTQFLMILANFLSTISFIRILNVESITELEK